MGKDPAGLVDSVVAVQQLPGGAVDVIDAATQQNRLQASARVPGDACRDGGGGQRVVLLSSGPCGRWWTSGGKPQPGAEVSGLLISGAMPHLAWPESPAAQACIGVWRWHRDRAPGDSPARHFTVIPRYARFCLLGDAIPFLTIPASWIRYTY